MTLSIAAAMIGDLPPAAMVTFLPPVPWRVWTFHMKAIGEFFKVPQFEMDMPTDCTPESIKYVAGQLQELIKFAESNVPGLKYDQDRHIELLEAGNECFGAGVENRPGSAGNGWEQSNGCGHQAESFL